LQPDVSLKNGEKEIEVPRGTVGRQKIGGRNEVGEVSSSKNKQRAECYGEEASKVDEVLVGWQKRRIQWCQLGRDGVKDTYLVVIPYIGKGRGSNFGGKRNVPPLKQFMTKIKSEIQFLSVWETWGVS